MAKDISSLVARPAGAITKPDAPRAHNHVAMFVGPHSFSLHQGANGQISVRIQQSKNANGTTARAEIDKNFADAPSALTFLRDNWPWNIPQWVYIAVCYWKP